eukprot:TRINITY_DN532_c0_g1_i3.p1 TRINITY_DN532_c0_g1~~TRINITY_DN532_c0_g1_i3.p1  ORF type:complete len:348 (-),score=72.68 TRINITY_DN532_c0_g1_i3:1211-2254(-)
MLKELLFLCLLCISAVHCSEEQKGSFSKYVQNFAEGFLDFPLRLQEVVGTFKSHFGWSSQNHKQQVREQRQEISDPSKALEHQKESSLELLRRNSQPESKMPSLLVFPEASDREDNLDCEPEDHEWRGLFGYRPISHLFMRHVLARQFLQDFFGEANSLRPRNDPSLGLDEDEEDPKVQETEDDVIISLRIPPSFPPESIQVEWEGNALIASVKHGGIGMRQVVSLPFEIKGTEVRATFEDSILKLEIQKPKAEEEISHRVPVLIKGNSELQVLKTKNEENANLSPAQELETMNEPVKDVKVKEVQETEGENDESAVEDKLVEKIRALRTKELLKKGKKDFITRSFI